MSVSCPPLLMLLKQNYSHLTRTRASLHLERKKKHPREDETRLGERIVLIEAKRCQENPTSRAADKKKHPASTLTHTFLVILPSCTPSRPVTRFIMLTLTHRHSLLPVLPVCTRKEALVSLFFIAHGKHEWFSEEEETLILPLRRGKLIYTGSDELFTLNDTPRAHQAWLGSGADAERHAVIYIWNNSTRFTGGLTSTTPSW